MFFKVLTIMWRIASSFRPFRKSLPHLELLESLQMMKQNWVSLWIWWNVDYFKMIFLQWLIQQFKNMMLILQLKVRKCHPSSEIFLKNNVMYIFLLYFSNLSYCNHFYRYWKNFLNSMQKMLPKIIVLKRKKKLQIYGKNFMNLEIHLSICLISKMMFKCLLNVQFASR